MKVAIHELKAHLSQYLHTVQEGQSIVVTSHNKAIAQITPLEEKAGVARLIDLPGTQWNGNKPTGCKIKPKHAKTTVADIVLEERE